MNVRVKFDRLSILFVPESSGLEIQTRTLNRRHSLQGEAATAARIVNILGQPEKVTKDARDSISVLKFEMFCCSLECYEMCKTKCRGKTFNLSQKLMRSKTSRPMASPCLWADTTVSGLVARKQWKLSV